MKAGVRLVEPGRDHVSSNSRLDVLDDVINGPAEVHLPGRFWLFMHVVFVYSMAN